MKDLYQTGSYGRLNPNWHEEDAPWKTAQITRMIRKNALPADRICEVGCGTGEILLRLEKIFSPTVIDGFEIAPEALARAKEKNTTRAQFCNKDIMSISKGHYDLALAIDVVEHVEDYISFLKSLKTLGTFKIIHFPLDLSVQSVLRSRPIQDLRQSVGHIHYFFKQTALDTLADCGYTVLDYFYTASRLELPNQAVTSQIMRWPRRIMFAIHPDLAVRILGGYSLLVLAK